MRHPILISSRGKASTPRDRIRDTVFIIINDSLQVNINGSLQGCNYVAISGCINSDANGIYHVDDSIGDAMIVSK